MRILFVSNLYPPNVVGGYEQLCFNVADAMYRRGHSVAVLASNYGGGAAEYPGQAVYRSLQLLAGREIYEPFAGDAEDRDQVNRSNLQALRNTVAQVAPDVIFAWNLSFLDRSLVTALGEREAPPVVLMLTDNWLLSLQNPQYMSRFFREHVFGPTPFPLPSSRRPAYVSGRAWWERVLRRQRPAMHPTPIAAPLRFPFAVVFGASFVRNLYADAGFSFVRDRVVHNGVRQRLHPEHSIGNRASRIHEPELRLLFAGRFVDLKGAHDLVAAMPVITRAEPTVGVRLTLLGDARDRAYVDRLHREVAASPCANMIEIRPPVPEASLPELFGAHDIYVFPSLYEPFSLTLIHALACGIPTAASRVGGNVEIVRDGISGVLFNKGDPADLARAVLRLANDPELRTAVASGGREAATRFTFENMVNGMENFLLEILA
jgi:glycogen synthase